jgi:hypothetical protein
MSNIVNLMDKEYAVSRVLQVETRMLSASILE